MTARLLLVRHAEQVADGRYWQHGCPGLTELGHRQAEALASRFARDDEFGAPVTLLSSKAARAIETAAHVAPMVGGTPVATCSLCEMHPGMAEGLTDGEMAERFGPHYGRVPGAEWLPGAVTRLRILVNTCHDETIVAVTHTAVLAAALVAFEAMSIEAACNRSFAFTGITEFVWAADVWTLCRVDDHSHLRRLA